MYLVSIELSRFGGAQPLLVMAILRIKNFTPSLLLAGTVSPIVAITFLFTVTGQWKDYSPVAHTNVNKLEHGE